MDKCNDDNDEMFSRTRDNMQQTSFTIWGNLEVYGQTHTNKHNWSFQRNMLKKTPPQIIRHL